MSAAPSSLRVLELCEGVAGPLCGRHLALLGARVERVEPAAGDRARAWGAHAPGALHDLLADGKAAGDVRAALPRVDVVLADEGRLRPDELPAPDGRPRLLVVFERERLDDGALAAAETPVQAQLGLLDYVGDRWSGPARTGADVATVATAVCAAQAVLAWTLRDQPPRWQIVRVSPLRTLAALKTVIWAARTAPDAWSGSHVVARDRRVDRGYRVDDGWITIDFPAGAHDDWRGLCAAIGLDELVAEAGGDWWETVGWGDHVDAARPRFERALAGRDREAACALVRAHGGSSVPFNAPREVLDHPQTRALATQPGDLPWRTLAGPGAADAPLAAPPAGDGAATPLAGLRVLDFGIGGVGPFAASLLGSLGADVVKVEAPNEFIHAVRPDADGLASTYSALNVGKRSVVLDLKDPVDAEAAHALAAEADVVLENFRPGAMARLGFDHATLAAANPRLVYVSASGFGSTGPLASLPCTDPHIQAFAGWALANAGDDGAPRRTRYYALLDLVSSLAIVEAVLAALARRRASGEGAHAEVAMLEAIVHAHVSRWAGLAGSDGTWQRERLYAPDGLFETTDGLLALAVEDDAQWAALRRVLGDPEALRVPAWETNAGRLADEQALHAALAPLLAGSSAQGWLLALGGAGVPVARHQQDDAAVLRRDLWTRDCLRALLRRGRPPLRGGGPPWSYDPPLPLVSSPAPGADAAAFAPGSSAPAQPGPVATPVEA